MPTITTIDPVTRLEGHLKIQVSIDTVNGVQQVTDARATAEAPRGALGHWLQITNGKISRYQIITPTCWNASPRDHAGKPGPIEQALIGTPVKDLNQPVEVVRVIHSFDPCLSCAVHVMRPDAGKKIFTLAHYHGGEEVHTHGPDHGRHHGHEPGHGREPDHHHEESLP